MYFFNSSESLRVELYYFYLVGFPFGISFLHHSKEVNKQVCLKLVFCQLYSNFPLWYYKVKAYENLEQLQFVLNETTGLFNFLFLS